MEIIKSNYCGDDAIITLRPFGDTHIGHVNYREDILVNTLTKLDDCNRGIIMGDLLECATKDSVGKGLFDTNMTPERQKDYTIELLRPYAKFIDGAVIGNHEERLAKDTSIDLMKDICQILGIPYLHYSGIIKYAWNNVAYAVNVWHGAGGGVTIGGALKQCEDMAQRTFADIYLMGHVHKIGKSDRIINVPDLRNMKVNKIEQHFVLTGSALDYDDGYADMKGLQPRRLGYPVIYLAATRNGKQIKVQA